MKVDEIKKLIEKTAELVPSFNLVRQTAICGECGFKDEPFEENVQNVNLLTSYRFLKFYTPDYNLMRSSYLEYQLCFSNY